MRIFASILIILLTSFCAACGSASSSHDGSGDGSDGGSSADGGGKDGAPQTDTGSGDGGASNHDGGTDGAANGEAGVEGGGPPTVTAMTAGEHHVCALISDGTVKCWGYNTDGQLGDGTSTGPDTCDKVACSTAPVPVSNLTGATAIAAGQTHTCALLSGGTVQCWGVNTYGELGDGTSTGPDTCGSNVCSTTPVAVSGLSGVTAIAAGGDGTCALLSGGTVDCWGANIFGQLGNGTSTGPETCGGLACSTTPVAVPGLSGVTAITAGGDHVCALLSGGTVDCFGWNMSGQLGVGTSTGPQTCGGNPCSMSPVAVSGLSGVTAISAGAAGTCALLSGGTVKCWGDNEAGELGNGSSTGPQTCIAGSSACSTMPVAVSGLSGVSAIAASEAHTCALLSGGTVDCWGDNEAGELGAGTSTGPQTCGGAACSTTPVAVSSLTGATAVATSFLGSCALRSGGSIECWGDNQYGNLGIGTSTGPQTCTASVSVPCSTSPVAVQGL